MIKCILVNSGEHLKPTPVTKECTACGQTYSVWALDERPVHICPRRPQAPIKGSSSTAFGDEELLGATVGERYRIEEILDRGGMGVVYKARHTVLGSSVAIKVLHQRKQVSNLKRFFREALLASKLRHPNIVYIYDFGILLTGLPYLVMEYVTGVTLASEIQQGPLDPLRACQIAVQIARGIEAVHAAGIIHRDLKPENIILTGQDSASELVKIIDFGIAKELGDADNQQNPAQDVSSQHRLTPPTNSHGDSSSSRLTRAGAFIGSPRYMSPEQIQGEELDARCDQYSFGCILYQVLTGTVPFSHESSVELLSMHLTQEVTPPRVRSPNLSISESLERLVLRTLSKRKEDRFPSMQELEKALGRETEFLLIERGLAVNVPAETAAWLTERIPALTKQRRLFLSRKSWVIGLSVVSVLLVLGGFGLMRLLFENRRVSTAEVLRTRKLAIESLTELASTSDSSLRAAAMRALGISGDGAVRATLEQALRDDNAMVRGSAIEALGALGQRAAIPALSALLTGNAPSQTKVSVARALDSLNEPSGLAFLERSLHGSDEELQTSASLALCSRGGPMARSTLAKLLQQGGLKESVELSILECLTRSCDPDARDKLHARLEGRGAIEGQMNAAARLAQLGDAAGRDFLRNLIRQADERQLVAARLLASESTPETAVVLRHILDDGQASEAAQKVAAEGLGLTGELPDLRRLLPLLGTKAAPPLRIAAARSALQLSTRDPAFLTQHTLDWMEGALSDPDAAVRQAAVDALAENTTHDIIPVLLALMRDRHSAVRKGVVRALGQRGTAAVIGALRKGLSDPDFEVRIEAIRALRRAVLASSSSRAVALIALKDALSLVIKSGNATERVTARSQLHQMGDAEQLPELLAARQSSELSARLAVVTENPQAVPLLREFLKDPEWTVRWEAARALAEHGERSELSVLQEAVSRGGAEVLSASYFLSRLGERPTAPIDVDKLMSSDDVALRMRILETSAGLPTEVVSSLLERGARDGEPLVRLLVVSLLSERLTQKTSEPLLRIVLGLLRDDNLAVRVRAAAVYARIKQQPLAVTEGVGGAPLLPLQFHIGEPRSSWIPDMAPVEAEGALDNKNEAHVLTLSLSAPTAVWFRIDKRPWQVASHLSLPLQPGPHTVATLVSVQTIALKTSQQLTLKQSELEQLVSSGLQAIRKGRLSVGQRALERAIVVCARDRRIEQPCTALSYDLSFQLAGIYEEQGQLTEAMKELQRLEGLTSGKGTRPEQRAAVESGIARLSNRLGRVLIANPDKHGCKEQTVWLPPGRHSVKQAGTMHTVEVRARQVVRVGSCT